MKKIFFAIFAFQTALFVNAQQPKQFLEVDYQMEVKLDIEKVISDIPAQYRAMLQDQLRQEIGKGIFMDYKLKTNGSESEYKLQEKISNSQSQGGMIASQISSMDKAPLFKNISKGYYIKPYDMGKPLLVKDSLQKFDWKISRDKEQIAGFDTFKATGVMNDSIPVTAWYSPKLNIKDGPDRLWGLPGLILKAEFTANGADLVITAVNVGVKEEEIKITEPSKGKTLTEKEFMEEMKKLQEQYKDMFGGGVDSE